MVCQYGCRVAWKEGHALPTSDKPDVPAVGVIILALANSFQRSPLFNLAND